ncbi:universal stress protein [Gemmatimonas sp.]|uniref:universal stress protein n=1 Tax=Gemmatimonas sp. TaxID=1962908 RepID=UPI0025C72A55|nr:universal stress protein [Gemmatimonas sp.]MCA2992704.1 universal stress protein [Gemmatimonas sp.]
MSAIAHIPLSSPSRVPSVQGGPVLVATDGNPVSHEAVFNAARLAASAFGVAIEVIGVCEPLPGVAAGMDVLPVPAEFDEARRGAMRDDLRRSVNIAAAGDPSWPIHVLVGSPARTLASEAERRDAALIVMGIGRHNPLDRLFGTETTLATLRESRVPILAVGPNFPSVPARAVVGLDFSTSSIQAAHLALRLLAPGGRLSLVHVRPRFEHPSADWQAWDAEYGRTLPPLFAQVSGQLEVPAGITVDTVAVRGDPAPALLAFAQQVNADLVAVGTQRHAFFERLVVGSVATRVLRTSRVGVLAVPATERER